MRRISPQLGFFDGAALLVSSVIGSGIFVVPTLIAQQVPEPGVSHRHLDLLRIARPVRGAHPRGARRDAAGVWRPLRLHAREAYGPFWAFLYGWTIMLVVIPGSMAALTTAFLLCICSCSFRCRSRWRRRSASGCCSVWRSSTPAGVRQGARRPEPVHAFLRSPGLCGTRPSRAVHVVRSASRFLPLAPARIHWRAADGASACR